MKKHIHIIVASALMLMSGAGSYAQRVTVTVAGNGSMSYSGDNGPAKSAALMRPNDVCIDPAHNLYFSDQTNTRVRKLTSATGIISTIAGGGGSSADGVSALTATINVSSICADAGGNVYIVSGSVLRRIDAATDVITTVAGAGTSTAEGVPAASASLAGLNSVCIDVAGNLYVVAGNRVRKIDAATGMINTIAGTSVAGYTGDSGPALTATLSAPKYIAVDHSGNIYFGDQGAGGFGDYIRRIDAATGIITTEIGGGGTLFDCPGSGCMIGGLSGLCCDGDGNCVFNEWSCSCRKWDHSSHWISSVGGNFSMESFHNDTTSDYAYMNNNYGICSDEANNYYIADRENHRIRKIISLTNTPTFAFGEAQSTTLCPGGSYSIDQLLWVTDLDAGQTETWTVVTPPTMGTLFGFPATAPSNGITQTTKPTGLSYIPGSAYTTTDFFVVKVSDGTTSSTIKILVQLAPAATIAGPDNVCIASSVTIVPTIPGGVWSVSNPNATISATGVVTGVTAGGDNVLYTVNNGCSVVTLLKPVSVVTEADPGIILGYEEVCEGALLTLTDPVTGGAWSSSNSNASVSPSGVVSGVHTGAVDILYNVSTACGTNSAIKSIYVYPLPVAGVVSGADEVCLQSSTLFTTSATAGAGFWTADNANASVSTAGLITGLHAGPDVINYNVTNECGTAHATKTINVTDCAATDLPVVAQQTSIGVYPNPAATTLSISGYTLPAGTAGITITDVTGRVVVRDELSSTTSTKLLNVSKLNEGVYLLTIAGDGLNYVNKIVISK